MGIAFETIKTPRDAFWGGAKEGLHNALDIGGLAPVVGEAFDLANAGLYAWEGDYFNAGLSTAGAVPFFGVAATGGKFLKKGADALSSVPPSAANRAADALDNLGGVCFVAGTQVVVGAEFTEDGVFVQYVTVNIEDVEKGDFVYSYDTVTGEIEQSEVVDTFIRESDHLVYVTAIDEDGHSQTLETTDEHPFWVVETETWVAAKDLRVGDIFLDANGKIVTLQQSCRTEYEDGVTVYNFEVEGNHNYFVIAEGELGQTCILVHNSCSYTPDQQALQQLVNEATNAGRKPLTVDQANTILDWADEINYPNVRASADDLTSNHWVGGPHIHIEGAGRGGHVPAPSSLKPR